ncbi:MAG: PEP-CTERM sorting domain-containing protein [Planctomycetota bacterium]
MKAKLVIFSCVSFMGVIAGVAQAATVDPILPWLDKWFQAPELVEPWGYDIVSQYDPAGVAPTQVVMDDWRCEGTGWVKGFRWWGSYFSEYRIENLTGFYLSIHNDHPAGAEPSHPGSLLAESFVPIADVAYEHPIGVDSYGNIVYEYFAWLDECFWQEGTAANPVVYWVNIVAEIDNPDQDIDDNVWGWHTAVQPHNIDDAVQVFDYDFDTGTYLGYEPIEWEGISLDMAFEVIPEPGTLLLAVPAIFGLVAVIRRRK